MSVDTGYPIRPVTVEAVIAASPDVVFAYVSDTRNDPEWCPNVAEVTQVSGDRVDVGSRYTFTQTVETRGRQLVSDVEVEVIGIEGRTITWRVEDKFQIREIALAVVPHEAGAKVIQRTEASFKRKPGFVVKMAYPMLAKRTFTEQFEHLAGRFA